MDENDERLTALNAALDTDEPTLVDDDVDEPAAAPEDEPETDDDLPEDEPDAPAGEEAAGEPEAAADKLDDKSSEQDQSDADELAGLSERARQRFERLTSSNRELTGKVEQFDRLRGMLNESIADPQDFVQLLDYAKALKAGDYQQALVMLDKARTDLLLRGGLDAPVHDPLTGYPDLLQRVEAYSLSREDALEIAMARRASTEQDGRAQKVQHEQAQQAAYQRSVDQASGLIRQMETVWAKSDPDFEAKIRAIAGRVDEIRQGYHPDQWPQVVKMLYESHVVQRQPRKLGTQPLRAGSQPKPTPKAPESAAEAMAQAMGWD